MQSCGYIIPESPVLALGSNFTALCILNESCLDFGNIYASQIIWKIKNRLVPKEQYREINRTVSSVTFNDTSSLATPLTCNILADGQIEQNIYGITVTVGCEYHFFTFYSVLKKIVSEKWENANNRISILKHLLLFPQFLDNWVKILSNYMPPQLPNMHWIKFSQK